LPRTCTCLSASHAASLRPSLPAGRNARTTIELTRSSFGPRLRCDHRAAALAFERSCYRSALLVEDARYYSREVHHLPALRTVWFYQIVVGHGVARRGKNRLTKTRCAQYRSKRCAEAGFAERGAEFGPQSLAQVSRGGVVFPCATLVHQSSPPSRCPCMALGQSPNGRRRGLSFHQMP
jgi:hypothetical protein